MGHVQFVSHEETRLGDDGDLLSLFTWILCTAHAYHTTYVGTLYTVSVMYVLWSGIFPNSTCTYADFQQYVLETLNPQYTSRIDNDRHEANMERMDTNMKLD